MSRAIRLSVAALGLLAAACGDDTAEDRQPAETCTTTLAPSADDQTAVQEAFIQAASGSTLCFSDGTYTFTDELSLTVPGITLRGVGDGAILDFAGQEAGANGINVTGDDFAVENLVIKNTPGDGIRVSNVDGVTFRKLRVSWDAGSVTENGAYAIYPVGCTNVLVEDCEVTGASDAGIYVGQSRSIVVRRNVAHGNVAGIEIENSTGAEVYENEAFDNTGGILVFNLPNLPAGMGERVLVRDNVVADNNRENFAPAGNIVAMVPPGTGLMILAADQTELKNNEVTGNDSAGVFVVSYQTVEQLGAGGAEDPDFDKYSSATWIHDNTFENNGSAAHAPLTAFRTTGADVIFDGWDDPDDETNALCVADNGATTFFNLRIGENKQTSLSSFSCTLDPLPPVSL
ncbi:parallel beta-helix domain-containing protein [Vulgatibacter sp.]|uniref:parallel beta-helix domain-containing protein n=1 Tax=Vulgatibacter sp. TaxID=1971226 RepID=UPI0035691F24